MTTQDLKRIADDAHDDLVELLFACGCYPQSQPEQRALFQQVHFILSRRLTQMTELVLHDAGQQWRRSTQLLLAEERERWLEQIGRGSQS